MIMKISKKTKKSFATTSSRFKLLMSSVVTTVGILVDVVNSAAVSAANFINDVGSKTSKNNKKVDK